MKKVSTSTATKTARAKSTSALKRYENFRVKQVRLPRGGKTYKVEFHKKDLLQLVRTIVREDVMYHDCPRVDVNMLFTYLPRLERLTANVAVSELVTFISTTKKKDLQRLKNLSAAGSISFELCQNLFEQGLEIEIHGDAIQGGRVVEVEHVDGFFGSFLRISYDYIASDGNKLVEHKTSVNLPSWKGLRSIDSLPVRPLSHATRHMLTQRGKLYQRVACGANYMNYTGHMDVKNYWRWESLRADGRIMADIGTYCQFNEDISPDSNYGMVSVPEDKLWMTDSHVYGFSFATKKWGRFAVDRITDIEFRSDAFDQLVLDADKKNLIRALVTHSNTGFSDVISGKGGGCIFLLHGEPGVGKTLTAEAIAELLQRPLYSVSVGQLGVSPSELESELRRILDVAQIWNAVMLIDEADIFLEKRGNDINRSAMTSVFLRLAEYHQGVLFLTTNRVKTFDPAFYSRVSIALKYEGLTRESRHKIWSNLLVAAGIRNINIDLVSAIEINGRQIKNTIRLAQGLARQDGTPVTHQHIMQVVEISKQFLADIGE